MYKSLVLRRYSIAEYYQNHVDSLTLQLLPGMAQTSLTENIEDFNYLYRGKCKQHYAPPPPNNTIYGNSVCFRIVMP